MENYIEIVHATKKFGNITVLNDVSVNLDSGKIHGLIGRNGSGKTMLMKCICGLVPISEGKIQVDGKRIGRDVLIPERIGVIIETPGFLPGYSGFDNLMFLAGINKVITKDRVKAAIQSVGLNPNDRKHVGKYSLGMRQRLGLAQAMMENPELLILDEPMNGLDKEGASDMRNILLRLKDEGKTILLASHSAEDIDVLCDTVCEMEHGKLSVIR